MQVTFYKITDDVRCLTKDVEHTALGEALTNITINPTEAISILKPELIMAYNAAYINANYCYIDIFDRYYFCTVALAPGNRAIVSCSVDPLMSFETGLKNIPVTVVRSASAGITYCKDEQLPVNPSQFILYSDRLKEGVFPHSAQRQAHYILSVNTAISEG